MELIFLTFHVGEAGEPVSREQPQQEGFKVYYSAVDGKSAFARKKFISFIKCIVKCI
jgi:hypothetical protein